DRFHNRYKSPYIQANERWHAHNEGQLSGTPLLLDASQRRSVELAIRETCAKRKWDLQAVTVRTNHAHAVVCIGTQKPERALAAFKGKRDKTTTDKQPVASRP